jgi:hypothetical protein
MDKKRPAKLIMQQRNNIAAAKDKLVNYVKETHIEPIKKDLATPRAPRAKFGEGRLSTYLGLDPASNEDSNIVQSTPETQTRPDHFTEGNTEHLASVTDLSKFKENKNLRDNG